MPYLDARVLSKGHDIVSKIKIRLTKNSALVNYGVVRKFDAYGGPGCNDNDSLKYKL